MAKNLAQGVLALAALAGCAGLFATKASPFWSTTDPPDLPPPTGLAAAVLADHPPPRAPLAEELQAVEATAPIRLERVLGRSAMLHPNARRVAFLPGGRLLSLAGDGEGRFWDPVTRTQLAAFPACAKGAARVAPAISPDGKLAANATADGRICVRDLADGHVVRLWEAHTSAPIEALAFTTGGELLSYAYQSAYWSETQIGPILEQREAGGELRRWRLDEERPAHQFVLGPTSAVTFAADGTLIVTRDRDGTTRVLDGAGGPLWTGKKGEWFRSKLLDHDRQLLAIGSDRIRLLDARTGRELGDFQPTTPRLRMWSRPDETPSWGDCAAITPDGRRLFTALHDDPYVWVWDLATRREVEHVHAVEFPACAGTFSPDGTLLVTTDLALWDAIARRPLPDRAIHSIATSADGRRVITAGSDRTARLWDLERGAEIAQRRLKDTAVVALSAAGGRMLVASGYLSMHVYDVTTGAALWSIDDRGGGGALSPDGSIVVTSSMKGGLVVQDVGSGKGLWNTPLPERTSAMAAFSPDGNLLAYFDQYEQLMVRTARDGREVRRLPVMKHGGRVTFSPDGRYLAADGFAIAVYDLAAGGKETRRIRYPGGQIALGPGVLAFSQTHGSRLIELSRLSDETKLGKITIGERFGYIDSFAISADGTRLFVGTSIGQTLVFAMNASLQ